MNFAETAFQTIEFVEKLHCQQIESMRIFLNAASY